MPRWPRRTRRGCHSTFTLDLEALEERAQPSVWHFDFGTATSAVASGYTSVPVLTYNPASGYGWQSATGITAIDRGTSDPLTRDFHQAHDGTFQADVTNGTYEVTVRLGDAGANRTGVDLSAEGAPLALTPSTASGEAISAKLLVQVADGWLDLQFNSTGTAGSQFALTGLDIVPADTSALLIDTDFNGTASGAGWVTSPWDWAGGGALSAAVNGGVLTLAGGQLRSTQTFSAASAEGRIDFAAAAGATFGMASNVGGTAGNYWALFGTSAFGDRLNARVNVAGDAQDVDLGPVPGGFHDYKVKPTATGFEFYVDGGLKTTIAKLIPATVQLRLTASAFQAAPGLLIDSARVTPIGNLRDDFNGSTLGSTWLTNAWPATPGGSPTYAMTNGLLTFAAGQLRSVQTFGAATVQGRVAFGASPNQHFGMATDSVGLAGQSWALFSTSTSSDHLYARVNANGYAVDVDVGSLPQGFHFYRIDPTASGFDFYLDGSRVATINMQIPSSVPLHILASVMGNSPGMQLDWVGLGLSASSLAADAGPDQGAPEGAVVSLAGAGDAGGGGYDYIWNFGDGTSALGTANTTHIYNDNGVYTVRLTVTDRLGNSASDMAVVTVSNVAPTATLSGGAAVDEGSPATVSFGNPSDPSIPDTSAGFRYSYDLNNDGVFDLVDVANTSATCLFNDNGNYVVRGRIKDKDGGFTDYAATVTVNNAAPTALPGGPNTGIAGIGVHFTGNGTDPSSIDTAAGFTYAWNFGDGATSTLQNPDHTYVTGGTYTVTLTVRDKDGAVGAVTTTAAVSLRNTNPFIVTPYDRIPNFGATPTIYSVTSGAWSDATTWSAGHVPAAGDVVSIDPTHTVTYDAAMASANAVKTVVIQATGKLVFRTDVSTTLYVSNLLVLPNGELDVGNSSNPVAGGVTASIIFANKPLDTAADPAQYGNGLIGVGKVSMIGAAKPLTFIRLADEPRAGQTTLTLADPATGWRVGDRLVLPDSRQLRDFERGSRYVSQLETVTISAVSADGKTITLSAALNYDHPGARDVNGVLDHLPHVANLTRNVVVKSESATGNRGEVLFTYRADVDVRYVQFAGLGRTRVGAVDDTTFDANGNVTHLGTNQGDRNPVQFRHLFGPATAQTNGYQYTFVGNSVFCPLNPMPFVWGVNINDSHYGLIKDNVLYNWAGAALVAETGSETGNVIDHNFSLLTTGSGSRGHFVDDAGDAFWFRGVNNYVRNNVATDVNPGGYDVYSYGFNFFSAYVGTVSIPAFQGADLSVAGQTSPQDMNALPLLEFSGNEVYGATQNGLTLWWIGTSFETVKGNAGTVKNFTVWHHHGWGIFGYETNNLVIDGFTARGNAGILSNPYEGVTGIWFADYMTRNLVIRNADIQGMATGIVTPTNVGRAMPGATTTIENSYLANVVNIVVLAPTSVNGSNDLSPKTTVIGNVRFAHPLATAPSRWSDIVLRDTSTSEGLGEPNLNLADLVFVYDYNGNPNDDFQVFNGSRAPVDAVVRALIYGKTRSL